jgi:dinuclear metal center YbgI/SA1388 family protein
VNDPMTSPSLRDVLDHTERLWPAAGAEEWDIVGLVSGSLDSDIQKILFVVDVTADTVTEAIDGGYDLVIAHHPLLLRGVTSVAEDEFKGETLARLIRANCGLLSVHTNGDRVQTGTSATLASALGLSATEPLQPHPMGGGLGIVGTVPATTVGEFARLIASVLPATARGVRVSGEMSQPVNRVTLCAGAGDSLLGNSIVQASDIYVTSDLRHHPASEFRDTVKRGANTALVDISHWAAEWLWLDTAASELRDSVKGVTVDVSEINTDPWTFVVV